MSDRDSELNDPRRLRQKALSLWDNEGGASPEGPQEGSTPGKAGSYHWAEVTNSELVQLRVRLIAMENLVIALIADASEQQLELIRDATACISPRPGFTAHPLTVRAATHMSDLVQRAAAFRELMDADL